MKTRVKNKRGAPAHRRNPPRSVVSQPRQQKETTKSLKIRKEAEQVAFHAWQFLKHLCFLCYHLASSCVKSALKLFVMQSEPIITVFVKASLDWLVMNFRIHAYLHILT